MSARLPTTRSFATRCATGTRLRTTSFYADDAGNIGMISAGYFPLVAQGQPWLPMPGTGEYDVTGTVPYDDIPQVYDPPEGFIWSANQRQVGPDYPYYIGTASNFFNPGYRANEIKRVLSQAG